MEKIQLPGTGVSITRMAFGAWAIGGWFWGGADDKDSLIAIETAVSLGMTTIDTAPLYGFGHSEELVGKAVRGMRNKVEILTKFGMRWDVPAGVFHLNTADNQGNPVAVYKVGRKESIITECENSLRRLKTDYIDLYQQHWPDPATPVEETMEALDRLMEQGKIRAGGVSNYTVEQLAEAVKYFPVVSNQVPYSMLLRSIEKDLVPWCLENNRALIAYSPLQRGILTGKVRTGYRFGAGDHRPNTSFYQEPNLTRINTFLDTIKPIADTGKMTLSQLVLKWTMSQPGITCVLAGARDQAQITENIRAISINISPDEMDFINHSLENLHLQ